jgi:integrase
VQRKTGAAVVIEWTPSLRKAVHALRAVRWEAGSLYVVTNREGQRYSDAGFKTLWNRLLVAWGHAGNQRFRFHDLRARSVGTLKRAGRLARDVTGHRTEATADRIYDRRTAKRAKAVE